MGRRAVIFDLDHTLIKCNGSYKFGAYLYQQGVFSKRVMLALATNYWRHSFFGLPLPELHRRCFSILFSGKSRDMFSQHVEKFLDIHIDTMLYHPAIARLTAAQENGEYVAILSNSPDILVAPIARHLGVEEWRSTRYEIDNDGLLCKISGFIQGQDKAEYLCDLYRKGYEKESVTAYSDSFLDLPFLVSAGVSVAVRPDRKLRKECQRRGWEIL